MTPVERVLRERHGRAVTALVRLLGDISLAEEAVADAFTVAVERWPGDGVPPDPGGWIVTTAKRRAIDRLRRESSREARHAEAALLHEPDAPQEVGPVQDDRLRLLFTCYPAPALEARVALALRLLGGLGTPHLARALLVPEAAIAQRLLRPKRKIGDAGIPFRVPRNADLPDRLHGVPARPSTGRWSRPPTTSSQPAWCGAGPAPRGIRAAPPVAAGPSTG